MRSCCFFLLLTLFLVLSPASAQTSEGRLFAELWGERTIHVNLPDSLSSHSVEDWKLTDARGNVISVVEILPHKRADLVIVPGTNLDLSRVYYVTFIPSGAWALCRRDPWFRSLYSDKKLGATIAEDRSSTTFRLFAPRATKVRLYLYTGRYDADDSPARVVDMSRDADGIWESVQQGDHHGVYYNFTVHGPNDPGNYFYETVPVHISDPYARVSDDSFGKSRVWRDILPPSPVKGGRIPMEDVIAYEVHVQDFTTGLPIDPDLRGTFDGMFIPGLKNTLGQPIGFDYIRNLGINTLHLMPVQEFLNYPDDEWRTAFKDDPYMQHSGISEDNYQWGYRTTNAFALESRYRKRGAQPGEERKQFRNLVDAFHAQGISVIIDVVPNHTGENMDGRQMFFNFGAIDRPYYYRTDDSLRHIGPFGNEIKTEERPMVQRWILDQLRSFVDDFGIDGFRIDLAGQIDEQTLLWLRERLPKDLIIYGEAWIPPSDPRVRAEPDWNWYKSDAPITFFQDDARNAFKGPVSNPSDKTTDRGFAGGDSGQRDRVILALSNTFPDDRTPTSGINYLDIHDNWTLADRFARTGFNGIQGVDEAPFRLAATLLFTSLGPIVLQGGTEIMRSKGAAPLREVVKETATGKLYMHGMRDTYNLRTPNEFIWENVGNNIESGARDNFDSMLAYWKGLIALRLSPYGRVFRISDRVPDGYFDWILPENRHLIGYIVSETVAVMMNTDTDEAGIGNIHWPDGIWKLVSDGKRIDMENGLGSETPSSDMPEEILMPPQSSMIWVRTNVATEKLE